MNKAGGIVAIVAGSLGIIVGVVALLMGWFASELFDSDSPVRGVLDEFVEEMEDEIAPEANTEGAEEVQQDPQEDEQVSEEDEEWTQEDQEALEELAQVAASSGETMTRHGIIGTICSIVVLALGIVAIRIPHWAVGVILLVIAAVGFYFGGTGIAFCMVIAAVGGILTFIPAGSAPAEEP